MRDEFKPVIDEMREYLRMFDEGMTTVEELAMQMMECSARLHLQTTGD